MRHDNVIAVIPARGGSKGIPRKNLQPLSGVPLIAHTIQQATEARRISRTVVTTDDQEIARVARRWGAEVIDRPASLAGDEASSESALLHALDVLREETSRDPDLLVFLQCTSPLRTPFDIDRAVETLELTAADSLFSAASSHGFVWERHDEALAALTYEPDERPRRQEIGEHLVENGSIYVFRPEILRTHGNRLGGLISEYRMSQLSIFQIDGLDDLRLHEKLMSLHPWRPRPEALDQTRLLVLDFDGVMTDDRVRVDQDGRESVVCSRSDGLGLERLRQSDIEVLVLSKETNPVVAARCRKLGIECLQGEDDKLDSLVDIARQRDLDTSQITYVGNDVNDLDCIRWAGCGIAVSDAHPEVLAAADWITTRAGGHGAVREVCDLIVEARRRAE